MGAAVTEHHRLGDLNNGILFLTVLEPGRSKIKVPAWLLSGVGPFPGSQKGVLAVFSRGGGAGKLCTCLF